MDQVGILAAGCCYVVTDVDDDANVTSFMAQRWFVGRAATTLPSSSTVAGLRVMPSGYILPLTPTLLAESSSSGTSWAVLGCASDECHFFSFSVMRALATIVLVHVHVLRERHLDACRDLERDLHHSFG